MQKKSLALGLVVRDSARSGVSSGRGCSAVPGVGYPHPLLSEIGMPGQVGQPRCSSNTVWRRRERGRAGCRGPLHLPSAPANHLGKGGEDLVDNFTKEFFQKTKQTTNNPKQF